MFRYLFCVLLVPATVLAATPASAGETDNSLRATLSIRNVDVHDPAQARAVYSRMEAMAHRVCDSASKNDQVGLSEDADCRERALEEAVSQLNIDALTAVRQADVAARANTSPSYAQR